MYKLNKDKFLQEINAKWKNKNCPMCGSNNWNVDAHTVTVMKLDEHGGIALGGEVMPLVPLTCMGCGNVLFVNPIVIKALDTVDEEKENK